MSAPSLTAEREFIDATGLNRCTVAVSARGGFYPDMVQLDEVELDSLMLPHDARALAALLTEAADMAEAANHRRADERSTDA